jgi:hypothetical protein
VFDSRFNRYKRKHHPSPNEFLIILGFDNGSYYGTNIEITHEGVLSYNKLYYGKKDMFLGKI